jgi:hypothetical protein
VPFFRRRRVADHPFTEADAYARCHGDRGTEILSVKTRAAVRLPERRRGHHVSVPGEALRLAFAARLDERLSAAEGGEGRSQRNPD